MKNFINTRFGRFSWPIIITALIVIITVVSQRPDGTRWAFAVPFIVGLIAIIALPSKSTIWYACGAALFATMGLLSPIPRLISLAVQGAVIISLLGFLIGAIEVRNKLKNRGWTSSMLIVLQVFCLCLILKITPFGWRWQWGLGAMFIIIAGQTLVKYLMSIKDLLTKTNSRSI